MDYCPVCRVWGLFFLYSYIPTATAWIKDIVPSPQVGDMVYLPVWYRRLYRSHRRVCPMGGSGSSYSFRLDRTGGIPRDSTRAPRGTKAQQDNRMQSLIQRKTRRY